MNQNHSHSQSQSLERLPFGETLVEEHLNSYNSPFKFNAKEFDAETGNYYYGARYYDPKWSIWLSVDAEFARFPSYSPYNYTLQNPINLVDPDGNAPKPPLPFGPFIGLSKAVFNSILFNTQKEKPNNINGRQVSRSSGIGGYGVELQGEKEGIADVPIAEKGTKVFTLNGEPLKELTSIYGPELPGGSTALIPDGDGFSHQNDNYTNLVEKEVEKLYTAKGQLKPNSSLGKDPDSDKSAEYGGIGAGYPTKDRKSAEKDSSYFDKSNYFEKIWIETETID